MEDQDITISINPIETTEIRDYLVTNLGGLDILWREGFYFRMRYGNPSLCLEFRQEVLLPGGKKLSFTSSTLLIDTSRSRQDLLEDCWRFIYDSISS